ncbi:hypothetical protein [Duganella dendranthematis]|uniref:hypothetical protein n=1 Tax=Duganella dendranthematis TaxID=2728021 RepID=UPI0028048B3E|nr:hypothetical protein [Duganella dendranthematis]
MLDSLILAIYRVFELFRRSCQQTLKPSRCRCCGLIDAGHCFFSDVIDPVTQGGKLSHHGLMLCFLCALQGQ